MNYDQWLQLVASALSAQGYAVRIERAFTATPGPFQIPAQALVGAYRPDVGGKLRLSSESDVSQDPQAYAKFVLGSITWSRTDWDRQFEEFLSGFQQVPTSTPAEVKTIEQTPQEVTPQPGKATPTVTPTNPPPPPAKGDPAISPRDQVIALAVASLGKNTATWDQWNFFWSAVTGGNAPAPEARGFTRDDTGQVRLNGSTEYDFERWAKAAGITPERTDSALPPIVIQKRIPAPVMIGIVIVAVLALRKLLQ